MTIANVGHPSATPSVRANPAAATSYQVARDVTVVAQIYLTFTVSTFGEVQLQVSPDGVTWSELDDDAAAVSVALSSKPGGVLKGDVPAGAYYRIQPVSPTPTAIVSVASVLEYPR